MKKLYMLIGLVFFVSSLQADYILKYKMDTEVQTYMYHSDSKSKLINGSGDEKQEIYKIGKKVYIVSYEDGEKNIIDMDEMKRMSQAFGGMDPSMYQEEMKKPDYSIKKTGKRVKVGGIKGEVWIVTGEEDGEKFREEMVVTKDKRVVKAVHAMFDTLTSMSGAEFEENFLEVQKGYVTIKASEMALVSFSDKRVPSSTYELPKDGKQQKMPSFGGSKSKSQAISLDSCYNQVCCGQTSGASKVLAPALRDSFNGYKLAGSGICDAMGLGALLSITSVEGALYTKGKDNIQVTLNLDDTDGGILRKTKQNLDAGHSMGVVSGIKNYSDKKKVNGIKVISGIMMPMNQETVEYIINDETTLTLSRLRKTNREPSLLKVVSSGGINLKKLQQSIESGAGASSKKINQEDMNLDEAVNMLKGLF